MCIRDRYEAKKNALVPEFYNAAYNQYLNQNATLADLANSYLALENNNYNIWANNEEQRQAAALQQYEQDYLKWLQDLDSIGYTVNELGQAVEKTDQSAPLDDSLLNAVINAGAIGAQAGALAAEGQSNSKQNPFSKLYDNLEQLTGLDIEKNFLNSNQGSQTGTGNISDLQLESDAVIDEMLDSIYSGTNIEDFQKTLSDDENTRLGYLNSLVSVAQEDGRSDVFSSFLRDQYSLSNVGTGGLGYVFPTLEAGYCLLYTSRCV